MTHDHPDASFDPPDWSPVRQMDQRHGPRCGAENEGYRCELERGHGGQHRAHVNAAGDSFSWSR